MLNLALYWENDSIVLGAFGCGAFRNDPEIVAQAYKNVLPEYVNNFKNIEFAVILTCGNGSNLGGSNVETYNDFIFHNIDIFIVFA